MTSTKARVLLVDDDPNFLEVLRFNVADQGYDVVAVTSGDAALAQLQAGSFEALVTDLRMPGLSGEELVERAHALLPDLPILVVTAYADVEVAVRVMRHGAVDLITKPLQRDLFRRRLDNVLRHRDLQRENADLRRALESRDTPARLLATSPAMLEVLQTLERVAPSDATVLIEGESGTGKDLLARRLHELSERASGPFVAVNCAAIPAELLESELFGHTKGAFTGATRSRDGKFLQAHEGTLFLDEIGALPAPLQAKLLRVLQEREVDVVGGGAPVPVDVRIVAATNADLAGAVAAGTFRADLFYRLNVIGLRVPPLRQRPEDILPLFLRFMAEFDAPRVTLDARAKTALVEYAWPGNVREVRNLCQRLALLRAAEDTVTWSDLPANVQSNASTVPQDSIRLGVGPTGLSMEDAECRILRFGLERTRWNQTQAARFLGISRQTLIYRMRKHGLTAPVRPAAGAST